MPYSVAKFLYSLLFYAALPIILCRLWWRGRKSPGYRRNIPERLGFAPEQKGVRPIWIHAVSVGETVAIKPLVDRLLQERPELPIVMTSMTATGAERAKALFGDRIIHLYCPYDLPCATARFLRRINPSVCLIVETELWPNIIAACKRKSIPVIIANARLSERSAKGYQKIASLTQGMLRQLTYVLAQNSADAERFLKLGLNKTQLRISGSIKFDLHLESTHIRAGELLKLRFEQRKLLILASSHEGEEKQFLDAMLPLQAKHPELLLVIVPRHPERFESVYQLCTTYTDRVDRHSARDNTEKQAMQKADQSAEQRTDIYLGDTMGDLMSLYQASDLVVMGGSFVAVGGHNPLEPAALGCPVIMGPHYFNFAHIVAEMLDCAAILLVDDMPAATRSVEALLSDAHIYAETGRRAEDYLKTKSGAVDKIYVALQEVLLV